MNRERAALVAAIRADPDDDTPRLVMADWFDERDDPASRARARATDGAGVWNTNVDGRGVGMREPPRR